MINLKRSQCQQEEIQLHIQKGYGVFTCDIFKSCCKQKEKNVVVLGGNNCTLSLLSSALEIFCPSKSLVGSISSASILPQMVLRSQLVLGIRLDSGAGRLLWVLGQAQVPGWPNQIEGKHLHLMAGGRDFSFSVGFDQGERHPSCCCL